MSIWRSNPGSSPDIYAQKVLPRLLSKIGQALQDCAKNSPSVIENEAIKFQSKSPTRAKVRDKYALEESGRNKSERSLSVERLEDGPGGKGTDKSPSSKQKKGSSNLVLESASGSGGSAGEESRLLISKSQNERDSDSLFSVWI
jgi:hypothetical protein